MSDRYLSTLTTPSVRAEQQRYGSRSAMAHTASAERGADALGPDETAFVAGRDGFYLATVGETGWPSVRYRGGSPGILSALPGGRALAWADLRGNRQYLSVSNLASAPRVSLFLMDDARQRRLKVVGAARVHDVRSGDPTGLLATLPAPGPGDRVERVVVVDVLGYDWNCPQHIVPRWTQAELEPALAPLHAEVERLRADNADLRRRLDAGGRAPATVRP